MRREEYELPVALKDIYVLDLEAFEAFFDRVKDVLTNERVRSDQTARGRVSENLTLRERPWRLTYPFASGSAMYPSDGVFPTAKQTCKTNASSDRSEGVQEGAAHLRHNHDLLSRDVELLEGVPKNDFGLAVGIHISGVECVDSVIEAVHIFSGTVPRNPNIRDLRELDVLDGLLLAQHPLLPLASAIAHAS